MIHTSQPNTTTWKCSFQVSLSPFIVKWISTIVKEFNFCALPIYKFLGHQVKVTRITCNSSKLKYREIVICYNRLRNNILHYVYNVNP